MIQVQLKLRPTARQGRQLEGWLLHLASVWNWASRKVEQDAKGGAFYTSLSLKSLVKGHGKKIGLPQDALEGTVATAYSAWQRCFKKLSRKPRLKGRRNRLNSIAFAHGKPLIYDKRVLIPVLGRVRFHQQSIPTGHIGQMRMVKRAQSQRGNNRRLYSRLQERIQNRRKDRNHRLSRKLVAENRLIAFSADKHSCIARTFGKSVSDSGHYQLRRMLAYKSKCRTDGLGVYVEVSSRNSTKTCSACKALSGPTGLAGLKVRQWKCAACGAEHDRDINAAVNTLIAGIGAIHETLATAA